MRNKNQSLPADSLFMVKTDHAKKGKLSAGGKDIWICKK